MSFLETVKAKIGNDLFSRLEKEAEKEVALAKQMPLQDQWRQDNYYRPRFLLPELLSECQRFEELGLKISPFEVVLLLFRCKMLFAAKNEDEYVRRIGGGADCLGLWREKSTGTFDEILIRRFERLGDSLREMTLLTEVNSFQELNPNLAGRSHQIFFEGLFSKLALPFVACFHDEKLLEKYRQAEPGLREYNEKEAKDYFCAPSIGFTAFGSEAYCYWHAAAWLRVFFNILRVAGFITPGQIDFGRTDIQFLGPKASVFLGTRATGCYSWNEDTREPWAKSPDGSLFLSFGYRGLSKMWLDTRTHAGIEKVFLDNKRIFEHLKNPWNARTLRDIMPTLDILSSATQMPDIGAKILLIYCCLEHLFVPNNVRRDNKKYIVGGINAIKPDLLPWFDRLYDLRCEYAHKGFVVRNDNSRGLVFESLRNILSLLGAKLVNA